MAVHLFTPDYKPGDATSAHTRRLRRLLAELGHGGELFVEAAAPELEAETRPFADYGRRVPARPGDLLLYQMAIGSVLADFLLGRPEPLVVNYHNLTPAEFFEPWEPHLVHGMHWGRHQLAQLAGRATLGIGVSSYNESELREAGFPATAVVPILLDPTEFERDVDTRALAALQDAKAHGGADWLFVGRIAPNKCQHDLVKTFAAHRRVFDPKARLHLVGGSSSATYLTAIERMADAYGIADAVTVTGPVTDGVLAAHYRSADVFVCLSEHEGFCVPLLEAMHHGLPIVAFAAAAVPETLAGAGLLLHDKSPVTVAAAAHRVVSDPALRAHLSRAGADRLHDFDLDRTRARFAEALAPLLG